VITSLNKIEASKESIHPFRDFWGKVDQRLNDKWPRCGRKLFEKKGDERVVYCVVLCCLYFILFYFILFYFILFYFIRGVAISKKAFADSPIPAVFGKGTIPASPQDILNTLLDTSKRKSWDDLVEQVKVLETINSQTKIFHVSYLGGYFLDFL